MVIGKEHMYLCRLDKFGEDINNFISTSHRLINFILNIWDIIQHCSILSSFIHIQYIPHLAYRKNLGSLSGMCLQIRHTRCYNKHKFQNYRT